ncbi:MAG: site-specific DNA-methyltransferase [Elusimicrobiota bacterium]|jgi:site-specific DNA-methyltransferase (adenine-specific)|nr:site-specific DNA-methyltransferase [Elusimicrobiota bacterium]
MKPNKHSIDFGKEEQYLNSDKFVDQIICGDCYQVLKEMPDNFIDLVITSPPYFQQREYGGGGLGNEDNIDDYINNLATIFQQCVRVIKKTGTIVFNLGDKYLDGNLLLVPYRFAVEVQKRNPVKLINELTWIKINPTPKQNPKKLIPSTEPFFIFSKTDNYYFNKDAFLEYHDKCLNNGRKKVGNEIGKKYFELIDRSILSDEEKALARKELNETIVDVHQGKIESFRMKIRGLHALPYGGQAGGRLSQIKNKGFTIIKIYGNSMRKDIIESNVETIKGNIHPAVYPEFIVQELLKLLTKEDDIVLDPFLGSGTTAAVAQRLRRKYLGIEIHPEFVEHAKNRIRQNINNHTLDIFI